MIRKKIAKIIDPPQENDSLSWWFDVIIASLIIINFFVFIFETVESIRVISRPFTRIFEQISLVIFTIEYLARIYTAPVSSEFKHKKNPTWSFASSFYGIIDLIAILPGLVLQLFSIYIPANVVRILRLAKVFRLFKLSRYFAALKIMSRVLVKKKEQMVVSITLLVIMLLFSSILMYFVERSANSEYFTSIPATMWWAVATLTTVGYGDITPITAVGKVLGGFIAVLGVGLFALPAGILAGGFSNELESLEIENNNPTEILDKKLESEKLEDDPNFTHSANCPHCNGKIKITVSK
jgi:voltage-gated potassium channel